MQGSVTPCIANSERFDGDSPVTQFYIWIPYILVFLFVLARLPYYMWKRLYSKSITPIFNGDDPKRIIFNFLYYSFRYNRIFRLYSLLETLNIFFLIFSIIFTHFVFNKEFLSYGYKMLLYILSSESVPNPGCHLFPTEVNCRFKAASQTGVVNETNFLCIYD